MIYFICLVHRNHPYTKKKHTGYAQSIYRSDQFVGALKVQWGRNFPVERRRLSYPYNKYNAKIDPQFTDAETTPERSKGYFNPAFAKFYDAEG